MKKIDSLIAKFRSINTEGKCFQRSIFLIIALMIASFFYAYSGGKFLAFTNATSADELVKLENGIVIRQDIPAEERELKAISVQFGTYAKINEGSVIVTLYEDDNPVQQWNYPTNKLKDKIYQTYNLNHKLHMKPEHSYYFTITDKYEGDNGVAIWTTRQNTNASLYSDGEKNSNNIICYRVGYKAATLQKAVLIVATIILICVLSAIIKGVSEKILMAGMLIILGLVFFWLCPVGMAPDEENHFLRAFEVSSLEPVSRHVGEKGFGGTILPASIRDYTNTSAVIDWNDTKEFSFGNTALYSPLSYLPQSLAIGAARFFTDNIQILFYAGRLGNFIVAMILCISALWIIPYGRKVIYMVMLFPLSLQEMVSMAPDGFIIGLSLFLLAYVLHLSYQEQKLQKRDFFLLTLICIVLSQCKIVYVVLLLLIFIIPGEKIGSWKKKAMLRFGILSIAGILNLIWLSISSGFLEEFQPGVNSGAQIRFVLTHIIPQYYLVVVRTTIEKGPFYIQSMIGNSMGALNIDITAFMWIAFLILYVYEVLTSHDMPLQTHKRDKFIMLGIFLTCVMLIYTSLYVQWTPLKNGTINGVQGRYFTPIISLLAFWTMYCLHDREVKAGNMAVYKTRGTYYYVLLLVLNGITVLDMIHYYLIK